MAYYDPLAILQPGYIPQDGGMPSPFPQAAQQRWRTPWGGQPTPQQAPPQPMLAPDSGPPEEPLPVPQGPALAAPTAAAPVPQSGDVLAQGPGSMAAGMPVPPIPPEQVPAEAAPPQQPALSQAMAAPAASDGASQQAPTGISNNARNNPLNLRFAGQGGATNDNGFAAFPSVDAGIEAAKNQFGLYAKRGINTLTGLVSTWAPPNENDTAAYITTVAHATGIDPNAKIDLTDPSVQARIIPAMSLVENGPPKGSPGAPGPSQVAAGAPSQTAMASSTTTDPQQSPQPDQQGQQPDPVDLQSILKQFRPSSQQQMLALASGLLSGPTFGKGLGKGLEAMQGLDQNYRGLAVQAAQARAMANYRGAQLGLGAGRLGVQQQSANQRALQPGDTVQLPGGGVGQVVLDKATGTSRIIPTGGSQGAVDPKIAGTGAAQVAANAAAQNAQTNADTKPVQAGAAAQNANTNSAKLNFDMTGAGPQQQAMVKAAQPQVDQLMSDDANANKQDEDIANLRALIQKEGVTGSTASKQMSRWLSSTFGLTVNGISPNGVSLAEKDASALSNAMLKSQAGGRISRMPLGEFNQLKQGLISMQTNPDAAMALLDNYQRANDFTHQAAEAWRGMPDQQTRLKAMGDNGGFQGWLSGQSANFYKTNAGVGVPHDTVQPTIQPNGKGSWQSTGSGVRFTIQ